MTFCMLCKDEEQQLYSICSCLDSNVCVDCYNLCNENKMKTCPICRSNLNFTYVKNYKKIFFGIFLNWLFFIFYYVTQLACPIYSIFLDYTKNNLYFLFLSLLHVLFIQNVNIELFKTKFYENYLNDFYKTLILYRVILMIYSLIMFAILSNFNDMNYYYYLTVITPAYLFPFAVVNIYIYFDQIKYLYINLKNKYNVQYIRFTKP